MWWFLLCFLSFHLVRALEQNSRLFWFWTNANNTGYFLMAKQSCGTFYWLLITKVSWSFSCKTRWLEFWYQIFFSGGTLGLFVGMSLMTGIEIILWIFQLIHKIIVKPVVSSPKNNSASSTMIVMEPWFYLLCSCIGVSKCENVQFLSSLISPKISREKYNYWFLWDSYRALKM